MKIAVRLSVSLFLVAFSITVGGGQVSFDNHDFESSTTCDPSECEDTEMSCVDGWWNFNDGTPAYTGEIWIYYTDAEDCLMSNVALESCGGLRGLLAQEDSGDLGGVIPCTNNPFYQVDFTGYVQVRADVNILDCGSAWLILEMYASDEPYLSVAGAGTLVGVGSLPDVRNECLEIVIGINTLADMQALVEAPYVYFKASSAGAPMLAPDPEALPLDAKCVIDNVTACEFFNVRTDTRDCGEICIVVGQRECPIQCSQGSLQEGGGQGCAFNIYWYHAGLPDPKLEECTYEFITETECCFLPPEPGDYVAIVEVYHLLLGMQQYHLEFLEVEYDPCTDVIIQGAEIWQVEDFPGHQTFGTITVTAGSSLTIEADAALRFCEGGRLVVEPNAELHLYGKLTAECAAGWEGVQVQGDAAYPQTYDSSIQGYRQGRLFLYPGAVIEHAQTGVALYGPGTNDTGGQLAANGATLVNNRVGISFLPYVNQVPVLGGYQRRPYAARILDCTFVTDEEYALEDQFYTHIFMLGVDDVPILGSTFSMTQPVADADNVGDFGYGILAVHAGFRVEDLPCPPPCTTVQRSVFDGLGYGIWAGSLFGSRPYVIDHAQFRHNYYGIASQAVASVNITRNSFLFSDVPDPAVRNDQIGIHLAGNVVTMKLQENHFTRSGGEVEHTIGIVSENLGTQDIRIRKNYFTGLTIANEAFGRNAFNSTMGSTGLHYTCNQNTGTEDIDFYVRNALPTADIIRKDQSELIFVDGGLFRMAAGNTFSTTTNATANDDFANLGDDLINYYFYEFGVNQEPVNYEGISNLLEAPINFCEIESNCRIPCLTSNDYGAARYLFIDQLSAYEEAKGSNDTTGSMESRWRLDSVTHAILDYFLLDSLLIARDDSLRLLLAARGEIEHLFWLAGAQVMDGDTSEAFTMLDSINTHFLTSYSELASQTEISEVIWRNAAKHGLLGVSGGYADSLAGYAQRYGLAGAMARNLLAINQVSSPPKYFLPGELSPRSLKDKDDQSVEASLFIRPNPAADFLEVLTHFVGDDPMLFDIVSMDGQFMMHGRLADEITKLDIHDLPSGLYIIKAYSTNSGVKSVVKFFKLSGR